MRCGKCNNYIPDLLTACPECGLSIQDVRKLHEEVLHKKKLADEKAAEDRRRSQRSFSYPEAIFYSFFSKYFYRDVLRRWNGTGVLYLAFASALWMIPVGMWLQADFDKGFEKMWVPVVEQIPRFTVEDGMVRYEGNDPHTVRNYKDQIAFLFTKAEGPVDFNNIPAFFMVTPTKIAMKEPSTGSRIFDISPKIKFTASSKSVLYWSKQLSRWFIFLIYPFMWMVTLTMVLLFVFFYAVAGKLLALVFRIPADFQNVYRMAAVAFTPCMVVSPLSFLRDSLDKIVDPFMLIGPIAFMILGFWHNREPRAKKVVA